MKRNFVLLFMTLICFGLNAQWKSFTTNAKVVNQIAEDSKGNIWNPL
jgi:hypothetical protein